MKKFLMTTALVGFAAGAAQADDVPLGIIFGFTGPLESITPTMAQSAEMAIAEVNASGLFTLGNVTSVRGDDGCVDSGLAVATAERLVTSDRVVGIVGADCSGVTGAILQNVARPNGIVMISPSATSPALSTAEDDGLFFRTAPSDARQGQVVADILRDRGVESIAISYTNNDYGAGLADSIQAAFTEAGGSVTMVASHEDGKADYSAEVGALAAAGGEVLVVAGYVDQGGRGIIRSALDLGAFDTFELVDGMIGQSLIDAMGDEIQGSYGQLPGADNPGTQMFQDLASAAGFDGTSAFAPESYDAAALMLLAMAAAGSTASADYKDHVMDVANAPGEQIFPGQLARALEIIAAGGDVDYVGASAVELIGPGESAGNYRELEIQGDEFVTVRFR
ncbi:ABC transporter substrate-binding protein [Pararhodobacter aggregans]|uniref:Branched-chain amino acid ABC transporter substrate-binding protein n=1 Tax=Pararhodobacter aggregans TaxID=404875 RepID=A0A2T7UTB3_9RHOB|nr:ABC transporter substrate-binding protein [Pararhodobacter aggregans]PTX02725.1 amino acid/amide ABC transporter substrate-binding protein (HAAT family) [Pararhodobacter aggregans]PVE47957.1 branched-chain amino acid ABC transporter substrate-binding protein [Pararhodobacter aggregans]